MTPLAVVRPCLVCDGKAEVEAEHIPSGAERDNHTPNPSVITCPACGGLGARLSPA